MRQMIQVYIPQLWADFIFIKIVFKRKYQYKCMAVVCDLQTTKGSYTVSHARGQIIEIKPGFHYQS